jgi:hypothetical protein
MPCSPVKFSHLLISLSIVKFIFKFVYVVIIVVFMLRQISDTKFIFKSVYTHSFHLSVIARII